MKIKITEPGFAGYTGMYGPVYFVDGISVEEVSTPNVNMLSAVVSIVNAETGEPVGVGYESIQNRDNPAEVLVRFPTQAELDAAEKVAAEGTPVVDSGTVDAPVTDVYTKESLEQIADKKGIAGLREIGDKLGVKGTSIVKLIDDILAKQGGATPAVTETAPAAEDGVVNSDATPPQE